MKYPHKQVRKIEVILLTFNKLKEGGFYMSLVFWLAAFLVFIIVEAASLALTSIWFAGGALAALIIAAVGSSVKIQLTLFALVSGILLVCVRPAAKKLVNQRTQKTNARGLYGKPVRITEDVDNARWTGKGVVEGMEWTVRAEDPACVIHAGTMARIVGIQGVKLIVEEKDEQENTEKWLSAEKSCHQEGTYFVKRQAVPADT